MLKVVYFSTSSRSAEVLKALYNHPEIQIPLCVTKDDVKIGRRQTETENSIKKFCREKGIKLLLLKESSDIKQKSNLDVISDTKCSVAFSADFAYIMPQELLDIFPLGILNVHFSLLPKYRGASPVQFAILNGDQETGVTFHLMEKTLDTGPVIKVIKHKLNGQENAGELYETLFKLSAQEAPKILLEYVNGNLTSIPQNHTEATYTYSRTHPKTTFVYKEDAEIDWSANPEHIERLVRAYSPWPTAHTSLLELENAKNKIEDYTQLKNLQIQSKTVKLLECTVYNEKLRITKIQVEGSKPLEWKEFKNGYLTR